VGTFRAWGSDGLSHAYCLKQKVVFCDLFSDRMFGADITVSLLCFGSEAQDLPLPYRRNSEQLPFGPQILRKIDPLSSKSECEARHCPLSFHSASGPTRLIDYV
jgi:hypothetical protein